MHKPILFLLLFWFCCHLSSFSQNAEPQLDTVVVTEPSTESISTTPFNTVNKTESVATRAVPQQRVDSLLKEDDFWYANTAPKREKEEAEVAPQSSRTLLDRAWFRQLLWIVILCSFIAVVLWYLYSSNILVFRKAAKKITDDEGEEGLTEDIFALNYEKEIAKAVDAKAYRQAVRLWYLRTLKGLSDKGLIDYRYGRTNSDYLLQLYNTAYHRDFFRLTRTFEYTWYGQFTPSSEAYEGMQSEFVNFKKAVDR